MCVCTQVCVYMHVCMLFMWVCAVHVYVWVHEFIHAYRDHAWMSSVIHVSLADPVARLAAIKLHPPSCLHPPNPWGKGCYIDIFTGAGNLNSGPHIWTSSDFTLVVSPGSQLELLKCQKIRQSNTKICMYSLNFPKIPFVLIFSEFPTNGLTPPINKPFTIRKFKMIT